MADRIPAVPPKKSLGQNYMVDEAMLRRMADVADLGAQDVVLEIGAGPGGLTEVLAERARRVVALEIDDRFMPILAARFAGQTAVEVVQADILQVNPESLLGPDAAEYKVVANLPYYITSAIIRRLLESEAPPRLLVITVQYEVALRMAASPGDMSLLAVGVQFYGRPEIIVRLSPGMFYPRPNVDSALVRITPHPQGAPLTGKQRRQFFRIVRAGFSQPRKQLRNSLSAGLHLTPAAVVHWMEHAGLDPARRAQTFSIEDWLLLSGAVGDLLK